MSDNGYGDYHKIAEWVRQQGYQISDDSLWRYGKGVQRQLELAQMAMHQAGAIASIGGADKTVLMTALKTVIEQKVLTKLTEGEPVDNADIRLMNAVANLLRASVFHQRRIDDIEARQEQAKASQQPKPPQQKGISEEAYHAMRNILLGRPFAQKHSAAPVSAGRAPDDFESKRQFDDGFDGEKPASTSTEEGEAAHIGDGDANIGTPGVPLSPGVLRRTQAKACGHQIVRIDGEAGSHDSARSDPPKPNSPEPSSPDSQKPGYGQP